MSRIKAASDAALEHWVSISRPVDLRGHCEVSDQGRVRSVARRVPHGSKGVTRAVPARLLKTPQSVTGHSFVNLGLRGVSYVLHVRLLVALQFLPAHQIPTDEAPNLYNRNGDLLDNRASNLCWIRHRDLALHLREIGKFDRKLTMKKAAAMRGLIAGGRKQVDVARRYGVGQSQTSRVAHGFCWADEKHSEPHRKSAGKSAGT